MAFKVFLDVNLILDFVLKRKGYLEAKLIFSHLEKGNFTAFISPTVIQICSYWIAKAHGVPKTKEIMTTLLSFASIIDTTHSQVLAALHSSMTDIEDAMLYYTALQHKLDVIISNDQHFQKSALPNMPVVSPQDFIRHYLDKK
ncbi:MAG: PIN domain-containing protein [Sphingobacterium sp.]|jgi:predicted nucleic acid-binding protein|nr:PIN domain-containing protein [Sphingobacterium sp.]